MIKGSGYLGTSSLQISKANQELVPNAPENWTIGYKLIKFSFNNEQACTVTINKSVNLYLKAGQGFEVGHNDAPISSFVVKEANISFNWIGMY